VAGAKILGLLAPPQFPEAMVEDLADNLRQPLQGPWEVRVKRSTDAPDAAGDGDSPTIAPDMTGTDDAFARLRERMNDEGWDRLVALTDLPLRDGRRVIVADAADEGDIVVLSIPALGVFRRRKRAVEKLVELAEGFESGRVDDLQIRGPALIGHARVVLGMVRFNRPWRIVGRLTYMLSAAVATAAFAAITSDVWMLSDALSTVKLIVLTIVAIVLMVGWLIFIHDLWEKPEGRDGIEQAALFNIVTALSLALGVACLSAILFLATLAGEALIIPSSVLDQQLQHGVGTAEYLALAWMVSALATVGGALGSGLEHEIDIRLAAYSYHPERHVKDDDDSTGD
jgi:uncharacterized membrane protein